MYYYYGRTTTVQHCRIFYSLWTVPRLVVVCDKKKIYECTVCLLLRLSLFHSSLVCPLQPACTIGDGFNTGIADNTICAY